MADLPSTKLKLNDVEVSADTPVTEALWRKTGSSINALIDDESTNDARITTLEAATANVVKYSVASGTISGGTYQNIGSFVISGVTSGIVFLYIEDPIIISPNPDPASETQYVRILRGATEIREGSYGMVNNALALPYTDTAAGTGNITYNIEARRAPGSWSVSFGIVAIEVR